MLEIDNYILVFKCIVKMGETFWPLGLMALGWFLSEWFFSEMRHQDKSRMQTKP
jgi:hypothetical protein